MTAEIAVMNRIGIALAADSASTSFEGGVPKIYNTADKVFQLIDSEPVGVMIYGGASFVGIPWETVIKVFRDEFSGNYGSLKEYQDALLAFLISEKLVNEELIDADFFATCGFVLNRLFEAARREVRKSGSNLKAAFRAVVDARLAEWSEIPFFGPMNESTLDILLERYRANLGENIDQALRRIGPIEEELKNSIIRVLLFYATKDISRNEISGVVVAGFGTEDLFPSVAEAKVEGIVYPNILRVREEPIARITSENTAQIVPFAQRAMIENFMEGVDPQLRLNVEQVFGNLLRRFSELVSSELSTTLTPNELEKLSSESDKAIATVLKEFTSELEGYSRRYHISPIMAAVALLPKDQLAIMAETLVALTSFKQKMSRDLETVGGEIDVAVISKGDGFVWIKRKHYFDASLNPRYFERLRAKQKKKPAK